MWRAGGRQLQRVGGQLDAVLSTCWGVRISFSLLFKRKNRIKNAFSFFIFLIRVGVCALFVCTF